MRRDGLGWVGDHLWAEDGAIFLAEQHSLGVSSWFVTYGGYLHLIPRALATAFAGAPLEVYPSVMLACTVVFRLIAYGYAARLFASYLGSARWGIAAAAVVKSMSSGIFARSAAGTTACSACDPRHIA